MLNSAVTRPLAALLALTLAAAAPEPSDRLQAALADLDVGANARAVAGLRALAGENSAVAETLLGAMYADGRAGRRDPAIAAAFFLRAANRGYTPAQVALARAYLAGAGVSRSDVAALRWTAIAERMGAPPADIAPLAAALRPRVTPAEWARARARAADWRPWPGPR